MRYIHFIDKEYLYEIIKDGVKVDNNYRGKGILTYPLIYVKCFGMNTNIDSSIQKMWKLIGAQSLIRDDKEIVGVITKMRPENWPMKIFIDIRSEFSIKFAELFDNKENGIKYSGNSNLTNTIKKISSERYVLEGEFEVNNEIELLKLISIFNKSKGYLRSAHSFDCLTENSILPNQIIEIINFNE